MLTKHIFFCFDHIGWLIDCLIGCFIAVLACIFGCFIVVLACIFVLRFGVHSSIMKWCCGGAEGAVGGGSLADLICLISI